MLKRASVAAMKYVPKKNRRSCAIIIRTTLNRNTQDWYSHICGSEIQDTVESAIVGRSAMRPYER
jgi:hypothetical protein